jgi:hypothetical protein
MQARAEGDIPAHRNRQVDREEAPPSLSYSETAVGSGSGSGSVDLAAE